MPDITTAISRTENIAKRKILKTHGFASMTKKWKNLIRTTLQIRHSVVKTNNMRCKLSRMRTIQPWSRHYRPRGAWRQTMRTSWSMSGTTLLTKRDLASSLMTSRLRLTASLLTLTSRHQKRLLETVGCLRRCQHRFRSHRWSRTKLLRKIEDSGSLSTSLTNSSSRIYRRSSTSTSLAQTWITPKLSWCLFSPPC